ncbi:MAG: hypothetical protein FJ104_10525, partial [Deltaproteobacteria bacterium]|nr:hypothetical protein [Deltaproteobacteria bacterium]
SALADAGLDTFLLDWRGSPWTMQRVLDGPLLAPTVAEECRAFTCDRVAREDIPAALERIRGVVGPDLPLAVLGHCTSGGTLAMAVAGGHLAGFGVSRVVHVALGLFYEVPWDGWVKVEDFILERLLAEAPSCRAIDPRAPGLWPAVMREEADFWPRAWLTPGDGPTLELLRRLTFMVGRAWTPERLAPGLDDGLLLGVFGPFHLGLFLHSGQLVRRGFAAPFDQADRIDRPRLRAAGQPAVAAAAGYLDAGPFAALKVTLVAAGANRVWHRDSIDLMYDWLLNADASARGDRVQKLVFPGYDLQELFWGRDAAREVYGPLTRALGG